MQRVTFPFFFQRQIRGLGSGQLESVRLRNASERHERVSDHDFEHGGDPAIAQAVKGSVLQNVPASGVLNAVHM